jgi:hypothetical protein
MATVCLDRIRLHALGKEPLQIRVHGLVVLSENVPARLQSPGDLVEILLLKQVGGGRIVGRPDQLLLLL